MFLVKSATKSTNLLLETLEKVKIIISNEVIKLIFKLGVYRSRDVTRFIDIKDIPDLRKIETTPVFLMGGSVTLAEAVKAFKAQAATAGYAYMQELASYWENIANMPVRNVNDKRKMFCL